MKAAWVVLAVSLALVLQTQTTLNRFMVRGAVVVDLVLVVVVYVALTSGPVTGLLSGTVAGLIQDALSSGVVGVGGLAKTTCGTDLPCLSLCFLAVSATLLRSASLRMATICSSLNRLFLMGSSLSKSHLHRNYWSEETRQVRGIADLRQSPCR